MNHKGPRMVKNWEDWHGWQTMKLKNLGSSFQPVWPWHSSFKWQGDPSKVILEMLGNPHWMMSLRSLRGLHVNFAPPNVWATSRSHWDSFRDQEWLYRKRKENLAAIALGIRLQLLQEILILESFFFLIFPLTLERWLVLNLLREDLNSASKMVKIFEMCVFKSGITTWFIKLRCFSWLQEEVLGSWAKRAKVSKAILEMVFWIFPSNCLLCHSF